MFDERTAEIISQVWPMDLALNNIIYNNLYSREASKHNYIKIKATKLQNVHQNTRIY